MLANQIRPTTLSAAIVLRYFCLWPKKHRVLPFLAIALILMLFFMGLCTPADMGKMGVTQQKKGAKNNGSINSISRGVHSTRVNHLRGVRSTRRPAGCTFVWVRNTREWSLCRSATPNTGRWACRLFSGAMFIPPQGICHSTKKGVWMHFSDCFLCKGVDINIYGMCYSQGNGFNTSLFKILYSYGTLSQSVSLCGLW